MVSPAQLPVNVTWLLAPAIRAQPPAQSKVLVWSEPATPTVLDSARLGMTLKATTAIDTIILFQVFSMFGSFTLFAAKHCAAFGVPPGNARCWKHRTMFPLFGSVAALGNGGRILSRARAVCSHWARSTRRWTGSVGRHSRHASGLPRAELLRSGDDHVDMAPRTAIGPQINAR